MVSVSVGQESRCGLAGGLSLKAVIEVSAGAVVSFENSAEGGSASKCTYVVVDRIHS